MVCCLHQFNLNLHAEVLMAMFFVAGMVHCRRRRESMMQPLLRRPAQARRSIACKGCSPLSSRRRTVRAADIGVFSCYCLWTAPLLAFAQSAAAHQLLFFTPGVPVKVVACHDPGMLAHAHSNNGMCPMVPGVFLSKALSLCHGSTSDANKKTRW